LKTRDNPSFGIMIVVSLSLMLILLVPQALSASNPISSSAKSAPDARGKTLSNATATSPSRNPSVDPSVVQQSSTSFSSGAPTIVQQGNIGTSTGSSVSCSLSSNVEPNDVLLAAFWGTGFTGSSVSISDTLGNPTLTSVEYFDGSAAWNVGLWALSATHSYNSPDTIKVSYTQSGSTATGLFCMEVSGLSYSGIVSSTGRSNTLSSISVTQFTLPSSNYAFVYSVFDQETTYAPSYTAGSGFTLYNHTPTDATGSAYEQWGGGEYDVCNCPGGLTTAPMTSTYSGNWGYVAIAIPSSSAWPSSLSSSFSNSISTGDTLIAGFFGSYIDTSSLSISDSHGNSWTVSQTYFDGNHAWNAQVWSAEVTNGGSSESITVKFNAVVGSAAVGLFCLEVKGIINEGVTNSSGRGSSGGSSVTSYYPPANSFVFALGDIEVASGVGVGNGYTLASGSPLYVNSNYGGTEQTGAAEYISTWGTGTTTSPFTASSDYGWGEISLAFPTQKQSLVWTFQDYSQSLTDVFANPTSFTAVSPFDDTIIGYTLTSTGAFENVGGTENICDPSCNSAATIEWVEGQIYSHNMLVEPTIAAVDQSGSCSGAYTVAIKDLIEDSSSTQQSIFITPLLNELTANGQHITGVNIDFEPTLGCYSSTDSTDYTNFLNNLGTQLHKHAIALSVDVFEYLSNKLGGPWDFSAIGASRGVDYIIMEDEGGNTLSNFESIAQYLNGLSPAVPLAKQGVAIGSAPCTSGDNCIGDSATSYLVQNGFPIMSAWPLFNSDGGGGTYLFLDSTQWQTSPPPTYSNWYGEMKSFWQSNP
jgi:hypothetical protein